MISPFSVSADFAGRRAMLHFALLFVVLHGVEAVAHLVAALVERGAGRNHFDERESLLLECLADGTRQLPHVEGGPARHVNRARSFHQLRQVECRLERAVRICRSRGVIRSGGRSLAAGHGIDQIVNADDFQIDVAARGVNQVIAADGRQIAIA